MTVLALSDLLVPVRKLSFMQASYSEQYRDLWRRHWWWQSRHRFVMRTLMQVCQADGLSPDNRSLLDIGCAGGVAFDDFSTFGTIRGIEPDTRLIDVESRWASHVDVTYFDSEYKPERRLNVILMLDVLEHIEDDCAALDSVRELLVPGGTAILTVPALPSLWSEHDEVNLHFRRYTRRVLRERLLTAGFEFHTLRYLFGWPLPLMYVRRFAAKSGTNEYAVQVPSRLINTTFRTLAYLEDCVGRTISQWPFIGSSLVAVVRRPHEQNSSDTDVDASATCGEREPVQGELLV